jgi:hypothetical protein
MATATLIIPEPVSLRADRGDRSKMSPAALGTLRASLARGKTMALDLTLALRRRMAIIGMPRRVLQILPASGIGLLQGSSGITMASRTVPSIRRDMAVLIEI